jgi:uncharacterized protein (TIGR02118 family)
MIKLTFVLRRRPDVDPQEFHRYWREEHGPLVARHADALRIRRYVQTHRIDNPFDGPLNESRGIAAEPYDGVAELWWDTLEDLQAAFESEAGRDAGAALLEDERRFIDLPACSLWVGSEHVVVGSKEPAVQPTASIRPGSTPRSAP